MTNYGLNEYQIDAMELRLDSAQNPLYALLGFPAEAGEVCDLAAKAIRDGKKLDHEFNMKKELGDCLWFISAIAADNGFTLEDVAIGNIAKLTDRKNRGVLQGSGDNR